MLFGCGKSEDKTNSNMELKNETVVNERLGIQQFRMTSAFGSEFELDYQNHYTMALKDVEVKGIPIDSIDPNRVLDYELVRVHAAVYAENEKWVLVSYFTIDDGDEIGWSIYSQAKPLYKHGNSLGVCVFV